MAGKRIQTSEICQFQKTFTLLDFEKSNSQNRHIYHFHASQNPDTKIRGKYNIQSGKRVPHMFRTCSAEFQLEQCSMPTKYVGMSVVRF